MAGGNTAAMHIVHFSGRIAGKRSRCAAAGRSMIVAGCAGPLLPVRFDPATLPATRGGRIESMKKSTEKSAIWSNLRCSLNDLDRPALLDLIRDLYQAVGLSEAMSRNTLILRVFTFLLRPKAKS